MGNHKIKVFPEWYSCVSVGYAPLWSRKGIRFTDAAIIAASFKQASLSNVWMAAAMPLPPLALQLSARPQSCMLCKCHVWLRHALQLASMITKWNLFQSVAQPSILKITLGPAFQFLPWWVFAATYFTVVKNVCLYRALLNICHRWRAICLSIKNPSNPYLVAEDSIFRGH